MCRLTWPSWRGGGWAAHCPPSSHLAVVVAPGQLNPACYVQADTYRRMAKLTGGDWAQHCPATNAAWLAYLADAVLSLKATPMSPQEKRQLRAFRCGHVASFNV